MKKAKIVFLLITFMISAVFLTDPSLGSAAESSEEELVFTVGWAQMGAGLGNFDPALFLGVYEELAVMENSLEGLFRYDFFAEEWVPELATGYELINSTSMYIYLRPNVTFHDGTPFNAEAVKWNWDRCFNITYEQDAPFHGVFYTPADKMKDYATDWDIDWVLPGEDYAQINQTVIIDEYTIRIDSNAPRYTPEFENRNWGFISPTYYAGNESAAWTGVDSLVGTGPFIYVGFDAIDNTATFKKFENYWNGAPKIDELFMIFFADADTCQSTLLSGEIDMMIEPTDPGAINESIDLEFLQYGGRLSHHGHMVFIPMPVHRYNITIRKAISYAFDYDLLINSVYNGLPTRCGGMIPKTNNYYNASINIPYRNLTIARQTMIDGGFVGTEAESWTDEEWIEVAESENPLSEFNFMYTAQDTGIYDVLFASAKDVGIKVVGELLSLGDWGARLYADLKNVDAWVLTTMGEGPDPWGLLTAFYESTQALNFANVTDSDIDNWTWYNWVLNDTSTPSRQDLANLMTDKVQNEIFPYIWLYHPPRIAAINRKWDGNMRIRYYYFADVHLRADAPVPPVVIPGYSVETLGFAAGIAVLSVIYKKKKKKSVV